MLELPPHTNKSLFGRTIQVDLTLELKLFMLLVYNSPELISNSKIMFVSFPIDLISLLLVDYSICFRCDISIDF